jgi:hypothetical protein
MICRFLLDIRYRNAHSNGTIHAFLPTISFHAVTKHVQDSVMEEFGDPAGNEHIDDAQSHEQDMQLGETQFHRTDAAIGVVESP